MLKGAGPERPSEIGHKRDDSQTYQAVDLGAVKFIVGTGKDPNVISQAHNFYTGNDYRDGARNAWDY